MRCPAYRSSSPAHPPRGRRPTGGQVVRGPTGAQSDPPKPPGGSAAIGTGSEQVEPVGVRGEPAALRHLPEETVEALLEAAWHGEVLDRAAAHADHVVMVLGEVLGKLV